MLPYNVAQTYNGYQVFMGMLTAPLSFPEHASSNVEIAIPFGDAYGPATWQGATGHRKTALIHNAYTSIIPANQPHSGDWERTAEVLVFYYSPQYLVQVLDHMQSETQVEVVEGATINDPFLRHLGNAVRHEWKTVGTLDPLYVESVAHIMAVHLLRHYAVGQADTRSSTAHRRHDALPIHRAMDYIQTHLDQPLSVSEIARLMGLSESYFRRLFHTTLRQSPQQYIMRHRVERAKWLLEHSTHSIREVATKTGFVDAAHFSHVFKRAIGLSPSAYRKHRQE